MLLDVMFTRSSHFCAGMDRESILFGTRGPYLGRIVCWLFRIPMLVMPHMSSCFRSTSQIFNRFAHTAVPCVRPLAPLTTLIEQTIYRELSIDIKTIDTRGSQMLRSPIENSFFEAAARSDKTATKPQVDRKRLSPRSDLPGGPQLSKENTIKLNSRLSTTYSQDLTRRGPRPGIFAIELMHYTELHP